MRYEILPFGFRTDAQSPEVESGKEAIKIVVPEMRYDGRTAEFGFFAKMMLPDRDASRFRSLSTALALIVTDVDQRDGFAARTINDFIRYAPGAEPPEDNLVRLPQLPLPARGDPSGATHYRGALVSAGVSLESPHPVHRPSVFVYLVLENYVSNVVGLDLIGRKVIAF